MHSLDSNFVWNQWLALLGGAKNEMKSTTNNPGFEVIPVPVALAKIPAMLRNPIPVVFRNLEKYGDPYGVQMGGQLAVITTRPSIIQHFLQKNHKNYAKSDIQTEKLARFLGKGLLTLDGNEWLKQRRLIQPGFHKQRIMAMQTNMEGTSAQLFQELGKEVGAESKVIDMKSFMMRMAFMMVSNALFSGVASDRQLNGIRDAIGCSQDALVKLLRLPFLEWWLNRTLVPNALKKVDQSCRDLFELINQRKEGGIQGDGDLLDMLLAARYEDTGELMTDQQLIFELLVLFVAGHETTANALTWATFLLAQNPEVVMKLRSEAASGRDEYLMQVINEVLRMYPPAWITDRLSLAEDEIDGISIKPRTLMAGFIYGTHHQPSFWANPEVFNPDRFATGSEHAPFSFLPFGGGPRLCIGMQFALMEMKIVLGNLIEHFDFEAVDPNAVRMKPLVTLGMRDTLPIRMQVR